MLLPVPQVRSSIRQTPMGQTAAHRRMWCVIRRYTVLCAVMLCFLCFGFEIQAQETLSSSDDHLKLRSFLKEQCLDCHSGVESAGGLDLDKLTHSFSLSENFDALVRIVDRVSAREMPPPDGPELDEKLRSEFVQELGTCLKEYQTKQFDQHGRVQGRRLTNLQLERTLQDLLGIDIPLTILMSEEQRTAGFATVASGQSMSHFQLEEHLKVVDVALAEAFRRAMSPADDFEIHFDSLGLARKDANKRCREPEMIEDLAVVWASRLIFYGRLPVTAAKEDGWYEFKVTASARKKPDSKGVWCTVRSGPCISSAPLLSWIGAFEATNEPQEWTFVAWLPKGHMLEIRPGDTTLKMASFQGGQVGAGEGEPQNVAGLNLHSLSMRQVHLGPSSSEVRQLLCDSLELEVKEVAENVATPKSKAPKSSTAIFKSEHPESDLTRLIHQFAERAFRAPVSADMSQPYVDLAMQSYGQNQSLAEALRVAYRAILCSPRFLYFHESPGQLDDYALANRLSYMLWNSMPDQELLTIAQKQELREQEVLYQQVERMLKAKRGASFVRDLAAEWLDLRLIDFTEPDRRLYPTFDIIVQQSMVEETQHYLQDMLERDASVTELVDSDFTFLDSRLARYYGMDNVLGDKMQRVSLKPDDHRGGILTHGAVLKVTANGTTTSPVIRGVWISERLMGEHVPPPPQGVPAIEPDIRGATSIRELLAKHRNHDACAVCHVKIDPPGFALENYDPAGRYRETYASLDKKKGNAIQVDSSYTTAEGEVFRNVDEFRSLLCKKPAKLAKNFAEKLLVIGTGALPAYSDRECLEEIVTESSTRGYGMRSIVHAVVNSSVFQSK